jgi:hypothetical protein
MRIASAAALYFAIVFGVGFLLGPLRVFWLEPKLGATLAVLLETPLLLLAMLLAARWVPRRLGLDTGFRPMAGMGLAALALVLLADFSVGLWLRGLAPAEQLGYLATAAGLIYVAALALFAAMPVLVNRRRGRP